MLKQKRIIRRIVSGFSVALVFIFTLFATTFSSGAAINYQNLISFNSFIRYDCSTHSTTGYTLYNISSSNNNYGNDLDNIIGNNDFVLDTEETVVRINGTGGTGFIIGDHTIATCAHCVYDSNNDSFIDDISISFINSNGTNVWTLDPRYIHIPEEYATDHSPTHDFAMIYVTRDLSGWGKINLGIALDDYIENNGVAFISGFPDTGGYPTGYSQYPYGLRFRAQGLLYVHTPDNVSLKYDIDNYGGTSGGPVYVVESFQINGTPITYKTAIGINKAGGYDYNYGVRMTSDLLKFFLNNDELTP